MYPKGSRLIGNIHAVARSEIGGAADQASFGLAMGASLATSNVKEFEGLPTQLVASWIAAIA